VLSGVPQGNVLLIGPLLFVIFINDLPQCIQSVIPFNCADDTKCMLAIKSLDTIVGVCKILQSTTTYLCSSTFLSRF